MRIVLIILGIITAVTGPYIFVLPEFFYENTPGLAMMGPFSLHFIRDVGLAYFASGVCVTAGALGHDRSLALAGSLWPFLHGLFHVQVWVGRGAPFDFIAAFDLIAILIPACAMIALSMLLKPPQTVQT